MTLPQYDYRNLEVWQRAHQVTLRVYEVSRTFPSEERYGLCSQLRRAAVSVAANIAEGRSRLTPRAYASFLDNAGGSAGEVSYFLLLSRELGYMDAETHASLESETERVRRMIAGLHRSVTSRIDRR